ncbi:hypothetical protein [Goodfellowiella coeruleoviolacea]|uniref:1,4-alpha-glucan branching enzyme n=1 Tax=Goodfellowiella coeruleoviolacea TaxID=334858 RepID=A0AAE3KET4_9PSEU|nr:hypothetical protein [Goodfellowiella coeruleoviolacea]MCP2163729.1 hypothetical protein [Goodfellowiella coeruleoviolacea]
MANPQHTDGGKNTKPVAGKSRRPSITLSTVDHLTIRQWAERRDAAPATLSGGDHGPHVRVLRFDFPGNVSEQLDPISWKRWLDAFDRHNLEFVYQEPAEEEPNNFFTLRRRVENR